MYDLCLDCSGHNKSIQEQKDAKEKKEAEEKQKQIEDNDIKDGPEEPVAINEEEGEPKESK